MNRIKKTKKHKFLTLYSITEVTVQIHSAHFFLNVHKQAHHFEKVITFSVDLMLFSEISNLFEFCLKHL